jgi:hypothetical protein
MCGFCNVWMCVCVGFVVCGCFGNMYLLCFMLFRLCNNNNNNNNNNRSAAVRLLGLRARIPLSAWIFVYFVCCVLCR